MELVGLEAVVQGLTKFQNDIGKLNSSLKSIDTSGNIVSRTIEGVSGWFGKLGQSMLRVAEVALGVLVRDAFLAVVNGLKEMIGATIEAGSEFQTLQLRLSRLNLNVFTEAKQAQQDYLDNLTTITEEERKWGQQALTASIMEATTKATQEQLKWVQRLAATTPYDFQDIANVYTLARSYGFADKQAQGLTQDISDFAAGMGLGNTEIERIIVNMGQMVQQGKVTSREMNDLARGAFVPVNDVLDLMKEKSGLTGKAFDDFRNSAEGVQSFMEAFSELVKNRYVGAAEDMARTFQGATDNVKDFIKSIFGFGVVTPILDKIGGRIADVLSVLTSPANFEAITAAAGGLGEAISGLIDDLFGFAEFDANKVADGIIGGIDRITDWVNTNRPKIIGFFENLRDTIADVFKAIKNRDLGGLFEALGVDPAIIDRILGFRDKVVGVLDDIKAWIAENRPTIDEFFGSLGEIIGGVFENLTGMEIGGGGGLQGFLDGILSFMQYVIDNKDGITEFVTQLLKLWGILQLIGFVMTLVLPPLISFAGTILGLIGVVTGAIAIFQVLAAVFGLILSPIGLIIAGLIAMGVTIFTLVTHFDQVKEAWGLAWQGMLEVFTSIKDGIVAGWQQWVADAQTNLENLKQVFQEKFTSIKDLFNASNWVALGEQVMMGIKTGLVNAAQNVLDTLKDIAKQIMEVMESILGIESPSKVFAGYGKNIMQGLAIGLKDAAGLAAGAMQSAISEATLPAVYATAQMGGSVSTQNNYTSNYNLTIHSAAQTEQVMQDYNTMQSLAGA